MSKMTEAHYELARFLRWHAELVAASEFKTRPDFEVDASVRHYHRNDRYREIRVVSSNNRHLRLLKQLVDEKIADYPSVRIYASEPAPRLPKGFHFDVSIWPTISDHMRRTN